MHIVKLGCLVLVGSLCQFGMPSAGARDLTDIARNGYRGALSTPVVQDPTDIVQNAYRDVLGRRADQGGLRTFRSKIIDEGWSAEQVREALRNSPEFQRVRADKIINRAYEDLLGRRPDPRGMVHFRELVIDEHWTEKQVRDAIRQSPEYAAKRR